MTLARTKRGVGVPPALIKYLRGRDARARSICARLLVLAALSCACVNAESTTTTSPIRFRTVDILIDPHGQKLAAYQIEFTGESDRVKLVGVEGGEHPAFREPPYYDPKALAHNRVILAALNAGDDLPSSKTRVARLHLEITGDESPNLSSKLIVAASPDGAKIPADVSVSEGAKR